MLPTAFVIQSKNTAKGRKRQQTYNCLVQSILTMVIKTSSCLRWCFCSTAERASWSSLLDLAIIPNVFRVKAISSLKNNVFL